MHMLTEFNNSVQSQAPATLSRRILYRFNRRFDLASMRAKLASRRGTDAPAAAKIQKIRLLARCMQHRGFRPRWNVHIAGTVAYQRGARLRRFGSTTSSIACAAR
jgi:hypothetical protein